MSVTLSMCFDHHNERTVENKSAQVDAVIEHKHLWTPNENLRVRKSAETR